MIIIKMIKVSQVTSEHEPVFVPILAVLSYVVDVLFWMYYSIAQAAWMGLF